RGRPPCLHRGAHQKRRHLLRPPQANARHIHRHAPRGFERRGAGHVALFVPQDRGEPHMSGVAKARDMRTKIIFGAAGIVLAVVSTSVAVVQGAAKNTAPVATATVPALTVTAAAPRRVTWSTVVEVPGAIAPWQEASISAQISGYQLTEVLVNVGDQ